MEYEFEVEDEHTLINLQILQRNNNIGEEGDEEREENQNNESPNLLNKILSNININHNYLTNEEIITLKNEEKLNNNSHNEAIFFKIIPNYFKINYENHIDELQLLLLNYLESKKFIHLKKILESIPIENVSKETKETIIKFILNKEFDFAEQGVVGLKIILLFKEEEINGSMESNNNDFLEKYEKEILKLFNKIYEIIEPTEDEIVREQLSIHFNDLIRILKLFKIIDRDENIIINQTQQQEQQQDDNGLKYNLILKLIYFFEIIQCNKWYQIKFRNEIEKAIFEEKELFGNRKLINFEILQPVIKSLIENSRFDVFKFKEFIESIQIGLYKEYFIYIFSIVEFDVWIPFVKSFTSTTSTPSTTSTSELIINLIKNILNKRKERDLFENQQNLIEYRKYPTFFKSIESIFKIEQYFKEKSEKKYLKSLYVDYFDQLKENKLLESYLSSLLFNLDQSPMKNKFLKQNLKFLLSELPIESIDKELLNIQDFKETILTSKIYQEKLKHHNETINLELKNENNLRLILTQLPQEILHYIIKILFSTQSNFFKLQLSLVNKDFFNIISNQVNQSLSINVTNISYHHGSGGRYSLWSTNRVSCIKHKSSRIIEENPEYLQSFYEKIQIVESFFPLRNLTRYQNLRSIDLTCQINKELLLYLKFNQQLDKIKLTSKLSCINKYSNQLIDLSRIKGTNQLKLEFFTDINEEDSSFNYKLNLTNDDLSLFKSLSCQVSIGQFFDIDFLSQILPKINKLTLEIEQWKENTEITQFNYLSNPFDLLYQDQQENNDENQEEKERKSLNPFKSNMLNLKKLVLKFNSFDNSFEYFDKLLKLFKNSQNLQLIQFVSPSGGLKSNQPKKVIQNILKACSNNLNNFKKLKEIKLSKHPSIDLTFFDQIIDEDWLNLNFFNFKSNLNFLKFYPKLFIENNNNNNNKRKFDMI